MKFKSNRRSNPAFTVLHWSHQKEAEQAKSKDEVVRRNMDGIPVSAALSLPSCPTMLK